MADELSINCEWIEPAAAVPEVGATSALLSITFAGRSLTSAENDFSKSLTDRSVLSAYPLALWIANSWWRLRWECSPSTARSSSWRMAHEMAAAGWGFIWPHVIFESTGEFVRVSAKPAKTASFEPIRYLADIDGWIDGASLEIALTEFVELVCARLSSFGLQTDLQKLWNEVREERAVEQMSRFRRIEAMLGFDAGAGVDSVIERFAKLGDEVGRSAQDELVYASAGDHPIEDLQEILGFVEHSVLRGRIEVEADSDDVVGGVPWERGYRLASRLRGKLGVEEGVVSSAMLADLMGLTSRDLESDGVGVRVRAGVGVRVDQGVRFALRKEGLIRRRFELSRLLADHFLAPDDHWLVESDAHSGRQQAQRAFAAEFLCPVDSLLGYLGGDYSDSRIEGAASHFLVSELTVRNQLVNLGPEDMPFISLRLPH